MLLVKNISGDAQVKRYNFEQTKSSYSSCTVKEYLSEVESRTQGLRPRTAFPSTDTLEAKDRNARRQGPRTQAQVLSKKKKKKGLHKNFSSDLHKKTFSK